MAIDRPSDDNGEKQRAADAPPPPPPPDRPGDEDFPSRAESRAFAAAAAEKNRREDARDSRTDTSAPEAATEERNTSREDPAESSPESVRDEFEDREGEAPDSRTGSDHESVDENADAEGREPESEAQQEDRPPGEIAMANNAQANGQPSGEAESTVREIDFRVGDKSLREHIDPAMAGNKDAVTAEPVDSERAGDRIFADTETGENDTRSRAERFRAKAHAGSEDLLAGVQEGVNKGVEVFGPRPTGQETRPPDSGPAIREMPHPGVDAGTAATGMIAIGILGAELIRTIRQIRRRAE